MVHLVNQRYVEVARATEMELRENLTHVFTPEYGCLAAEVVDQMAAWIGRLIDPPHRLVRGELVRGVGSGRMDMTNYRGLDIPFTRMGKVTSDDLFGPNEQVIFDFYAANRDRYRRAVDIGANIGVHSILMARLGWEVRAYEPDPHHFALLRANVAAHDVAIAATEAAVSDWTGTTSFVRVLDNTTGSHLFGAKNSYGPRECFDVEVVNCRPLFDWADFVKIDCEGHEAVIIEALEAEVWRRTDALLEVGSPESARRIYQHIMAARVPMWAQKIEWGRVRSIDDMPMRHQGGSLFIGVDPPFPIIDRAE